MTSFFATAVQFTGEPLGTAGNIERLEHHIRRSASDGASLIVLPELCDTGYILVPELFRASHPLPGPTGELLSSLTRELDVTIVTAIAVDTGRGELRNTGLIVTPDGIVATGSKRALWGDEGEVFTPGNPNEQVIADTPVGRVGVAICYEAGFPEVVRRLALDGARIIAVPAAFGAPRLHAWLLLTRSRALENGCYLVAANNFGEVDGRKFCGHSTIVDPHGERSAVLAEGQGRVTARLDLDVIDRARRAIPYLHDLCRVDTPAH